MPVVITIELIADRYDAGGGQDPRQPEWPPHPARLVAALRSVAEDTDDVAALRELERLPAPLVHASDNIWTLSTSGYVVTNRIDGKGGHQTHPGRTSGLRERRSVVPSSSRVLMIWPADLSSETTARLDKLASRVPYFGRSSSPALMSVSDAANSVVRSDLACWEPCSRGESEMALRVPYVGFVEELEALFAAGLPAWQASDGGRAMQGYRQQRSDPSDVEPPVTQSIRQSPYRDLVVLRFVDRYPEGRLVTSFTRALRSHVMRQTIDPLPPALHGHGADGVPHVAYLGLPVVGHPHADGHLVGLAVAIPLLDAEERRRVMRGVVGAGGHDVHLAVPGLTQAITLRHDPEALRPTSATPERWRRRSGQWCTATPIVLDRYPKKRQGRPVDDEVADIVRESCRRAGLPTPTHVAVSRAPMTPGAVSLLPRDLPRRSRGRLFCHARLVFDQPLEGPVLIGAGRYFGAGLLVPEVPR